MPIGLKNAPRTFQRAMDILMRKIKWQFALVYSDNTKLFLRTADKHIEHVRRVLTLLIDVDMTLNLKKCEFITNRIDYLGNDIRPGRVELLTQTIDAVQGLEHTTSLRDLRSFLWYCNVLPRFVPEFTCVAPPINKKLQEGGLQTFEG